MRDRPLHFRALDRLAVLGNRSYNNPVLATGFGFFMAPLGISPNYIELSLIRCAQGEYPPLVVYEPKFRPGLVRQLKIHGDLFQPLLDAPASADVCIGPDGRFSIRGRNSGPADLYAQALLLALEQGLESKVNDAVAQAQDYFRGYLAAVVRLLGDPDSDPALVALFIESPGEFAKTLLSSLGSAIAGE